MASISFMHQMCSQNVTCKTSPERALAMQMIQLVRAVTGGQSYAMAGRQLGLASTSARDRIGKFVDLLRTPQRWGLRSDLTPILGLSLHVLFLKHAGAMWQAANNLEREMRGAGLTVWAESLCEVKVPAMQSDLPPAPQWTPELDGMLGSRSDTFVAHQLGTTHRHVRMRRLCLGIPAYRKAGNSMTLASHVTRATDSGQGSLAA